MVGLRASGTHGRANQIAPKISAEQELMNDFMSLIASFSGKFYQLRGYTQQKQLLTQAEHNIDQKMQEKEG